MISTRQLSDEDLSGCCCKIETPHYHYVEEDDDGGKESRETLTSIETSLYTLSSRDVRFVEHRCEWLNDKFITASQEIFAQQFPHIGGLQPPTLQEVRGFRVHSGEFVQIINVSNMHWCVVSTVDCEPGEVKVYDTMYRSVRFQSLPASSTVNCHLSKYT